ncbi:Rqc2 family fibronectin-binding protein [Paenibacillus sp. y28]|uniref:Rqc2 family fibronectin-binding protein n=1 Tax=Paenibacillus sp. y28 TaxID=3129110 RepID=UPI00301B6B8A
MSLDGFVCRAIVQELQPFVGGRMNKIHQPTGHDVLIQLRSQGTSGRLLLSASPTYPRVHFTEAAFVNPPEAPMFCMLLRKHCEGGVIESITQVGLERIIHIDVRQYDELGDLSFKRIVIELMGRHSNIILMDPQTGTILDGIHHVTPAISSYRIVMPGVQYVSPPDQGKLDPLLVSQSDFNGALQLPTDEQRSMEAADAALYGGMMEEQSNASARPVHQLLVSRFNGMSPLVAREIVFRATGNPEARSNELEAGKLWSALESVTGRIRQHDYVPEVIIPEAGTAAGSSGRSVLQQTGKTIFSVVGLTHAYPDSTKRPAERRNFERASDMLEYFYAEKAQRDTVRQRALDLTRFLQNEKNKNIKKLEKLQASAEEAQEADKYRITGELLTASLHLFKRGDKQVEVINYYDEDQPLISIELDPQQTPSENAQRYFKRYSKFKNSLAAIAEQTQISQDEIAYFDTLLQQLEQAELRDLQEIREELIDQGYLRDRKKQVRKKKKNDKPSITCYTSSEGIPIYVGKNNLQNEYVSQRLGQPSDTWLHTKDIPGSHVLIRAHEFGETTLHEAAMLAAYFSQARESGNVPVDYTFIRHVRKPSGAKPGFVIYDHQKTLFVTADEQRIKALPCNVK